MRKMLKALAAAAMFSLLVAGQGVATPNMSVNGNTGNYNCAMCHATWFAGFGPLHNLATTAHGSAGCTTCHVNGAGALPVPISTCTGCHSNMRSGPIMNMTCNGMCHAAVNPCANVNCDDGNSCTDDTCSNGNCSNIDNGTCVTDLCLGVACNDGDSCTDDVCDSANGICQYIDNGSCNVDPCAGINCNDFDPCTDDSCNYGACSNVDNGTCVTPPPPPATNCAGSCHGDRSANASCNTGSSHVPGRVSQAAFDAATGLSCGGGTTPPPATNCAGSCHGDRSSSASCGTASSHVPGRVSQSAFDAATGLSCGGGTPPPSGGGHPFNFSDPEEDHQAYVEDNGVDACLSCHTITSQSGSMSCYRCHGKEWEDPTGGGTPPPSGGGHPFNFSDPEEDHQAYVEDNGVDACLSCHTITSQSGFMSCYRCHDQKWEDPTGGSGGGTGGGTTNCAGSCHGDRSSSASCGTASSHVPGRVSQSAFDAATGLSCGGGTGGGSGGGHPYGFTDPRRDHRSYVERNGVSGCLSCHSTDSADAGRPMSCYNCHDNKWGGSGGSTSSDGDRDGDRRRRRRRD